MQSADAPYAKLSLSLSLRCFFDLVLRCFGIVSSCLSLMGIKTTALQHPQLLMLSDSRGVCDVAGSFSANSPPLYHQFMTILYLALDFEHISTKDIPPKETQRSSVKPFQLTNLPIKGMCTTRPCAGGRLKTTILCRSTRSTRAKRAQSMGRGRCNFWAPMRPRSSSACSCSARSRREAASTS